jgi:hypothetical protein
MELFSPLLMVWHSIICGIQELMFIGTMLLKIWWKLIPHTPLLVHSENPLDFYFSKWIEIAHAHIPPL